MDPNGRHRYRRVLRQIFARATVKAEHDSGGYAVPRRRRNSPILQQPLRCARAITSQPAIWDHKSKLPAPRMARGCWILHHSSFCGCYGKRAGQGHTQSRAATAAREARQSAHAGQGAVCPEDDAHRTRDSIYRLLYQRLFGGWRRVAHQRRKLAGDARFAQP